MKRGYARVSTDEQHLDLQLSALWAAGVADDAIYIDRASGALAAASRPGLVALLEASKPGDVLVVWRLDRIARSLQHLLELLADLESRDVSIVSLTDPIDTTTASGRFVAQLFGALAQFERGQLLERQRAGIDAARARGVVFGRRAALSPHQAQAVRRMAMDGHSVRSMAQLFGVNRATIQAAIDGRPPYDVGNNASAAE
jgi:DNA invertase Pin-like site-specific DNA recombinase